MNTALIYHPNLTKYSLGEGHPLTPHRFTLFMDFLKMKFPAYQDIFAMIEPPLVEDKILQLVHTPEYIQKLRAASKGETIDDIYRYVSQDNLDPSTGYIAPDTEEASRIIAGSTLLAGKLVAENKVKRAISIGSGMHHAKPAYAEGFCFYNDIAILVKYLKKEYKLKKIMIIDTDAHAGNGTSEVFYDDPQVLFIDLHQDPLTLYPGCGFIEEVGEGKGKGYNINLVLPVGAGNKCYEYLFEEVIFPIALEFKPEFIIRYGGSDPHYQDPLTNLGLSISGFYMIGQKIKILSDILTAGKSVDLILSGYNLKVLPFAWFNLIAGLLAIKEIPDYLNEENPPPLEIGLSQTKEMARQLKKYLARYWRCINK